MAVNANYRLITWLTEASIGLTKALLWAKWCAIRIKIVTLDTDSGIEIPDN